MADNQITPFQLTDQFTMDNFNQRINETNTALQNKADLGEDGKVPSSQLPEMGYSKSETLSDTTKTLFGLTPDAVPDDALAFLGRYAEHWWKRRTNQEQYIENREGPSLNTIYSYASPSNVAHFQCSESISISSDGTISLVSPETVDVSYNTYTTANAFKGKYIQEYSEAPIYYVPADASDAQTSSTAYQYFIKMNSYKITSVIGTVVGEWEYVQSTNRFAYPDSGVQSGYEYKYLGIPFDNFLTQKQVASGSYVGTNTSGIDSPNSIYVGFDPSMVIIFGKTSDTQNYGTLLILMPQGSTYKGSTGIHDGRQESYPLSPSSIYSKVEDGFVFWYSTGNATIQANGCTNASTPYYWTAIG